MSYASIASNNAAKVHLDNAIDLYEQTIKTIKGDPKITNDNPRMDKIVDTINEEISKIANIRNQIDSINSTIKEFEDEKERRLAEEKLKKRNQNANNNQIN